MSGHGKNSGLPAELQRVRASLEAWRAGKQRGERIPDPLWSAAVRSAREHGVYPVSRALGLEYSQLKRRVGEPRESKTGPRSGASEFVELSGDAGEPGSGCVIELEKGNGTRMRISVGDAATVDWGRMKEAFLGA